MKNSTEFAGDLTLCLYCAGSVLYYRVRHTQDKRLTVDTDTTFSNVSLTVQYTPVLYIYNTSSPIQYTPYTYTNRAPKRRGVNIHGNHQRKRGSSFSRKRFHRETFFCCSKNLLNCCVECILLNVLCYNVQCLTDSQI